MAEYYLGDEPEYCFDRNDALQLAKAIGENNEDAGWQAVIDSIKEWHFGREYFENGFDRNRFLALGTQTRHKTMDRQGSAASYIRLHRMSAGVPLAKVDRPEHGPENKDYAEYISDFLEIQSVKAFGEMFCDAGNQLMSEKIPELDWRDPYSVVSGFRHIQMLGILSVDYLQLMEELSSDREFAGKFGGRTAMNQMTDRLGGMSQFARCVSDAFDPSQPEAARIAGRMAIEQYGHLFAGKKLQSLPADAMLVDEIESYRSNMTVWYAQANSEDRDRVKGYLSGTEPKPEELFEQLRRKNYEQQMDILHLAEDSSLRSAELGAIQSLCLFQDKPEQPALYFQLRRQSGKLVKTDDDTPDKADEKQAMVEEGDFCFRATCRSMGLDVTHPMYKEAGYKSAEDLFFIDGVPAKEYVEKLYPHENLTATERGRKLLRAEIVSAVLSGEHHVEAAKLGISRDGAYEVGVVEVRLDDRMLDGQERFYQTRPSKKAEKFYADDKMRTQRQNAIRGKVSERFAAAAAKKINNVQYEKHPFAAADREFSVDNPKLTKDYFDEAAMEKLGGISPELAENNFDLGRKLAQVYLLGRHPEIRVADLLDSTKYVREKREAGKELAEACTEIDARRKDKNQPLQKSVEFLKTCMKTTVDMDLRRELMYALGESDELKGDEARAVMDRPENNLRINSFLRNTDKLIAGARDVFHNWSAVQRGLSREEMGIYSSAGSVIWSLSAEREWGDAVEKLLRGERNLMTPEACREEEENALTSRIAADYVRDAIARYGKAMDMSSNERDELYSVTHAGQPERKNEEIRKQVKTAIDAHIAGFSVDKMMNKPSVKQWIKEASLSGPGTADRKDQIKNARVKVEFSDLEKAEHGGKETAAAATTTTEKEALKEEKAEKKQMEGRSM